MIEHPIAVGCFWPKGFPQLGPPTDYTYLGSDRLYGVPVNHVIWHFKPDDSLIDPKVRMGVIFIFQDPQDQQKFYQCAYATEMNEEGEPFFITPSFFPFDL